MDQLQVRLAIEDAELIAGALEAAQRHARLDQDIKDLARLETWLRYRIARARQRATTTPAA